MTPRIHQSSLFSSSSSSSLAQGDSKAATITFRHVKAVIFDIDGTLADSGKLGFDATNSVLKKNNYSTITMEEYLDSCRFTTPVRLARNVGLSEETDKEEFDTVGKQLGQEFDDFYIELVSMETAAFFPGILKVIENLPSSVALGALTNAAGRYAHAVLKSNSAAAGSAPGSKFTTAEESLYLRFGSIYGADEVPRPKPYGDGLLQVCNDLVVSPKDCVYIGDAPSDGMAAKACGMPAIGVIWGAHTEESLRSANMFDYICNSVVELQNLLPQDE